MPDLESRLRDELRREREAFQPSSDLAGRIGAQVRRSRQRRVALMSAAAAVVLVLAAAGAVQVAGGADDTSAVEIGDRPSPPGGGTAEPSTSTPPTTSTPTTTVPPPVVALAIAGVDAPTEMDNSTDECGNTTAFGGANLVDGAHDTAWRMPGDGTGQTITLDLGGEHRVNEVGLVPGYAKVDPCDDTDRFPQNRRPTAVTWRFQDGTEVTQVLQDVGELQIMLIEVPATTGTVELVIDGVTPLPAGGTTYNNTAISEIVVRGS